MNIPLAEHQLDAIKRMHNGCILNGGTGSGKSRTSLAYYFLQHGGQIEPYKLMDNPKDLYIITTARKRDSRDWDMEMSLFLLSQTKDPTITPYDINVVVDSWNNIKKYEKVYNAFFIFDEDRVTGYGTWVKAFLNITRKNRWIILSATPGDCWMDYCAVFIANGFYKNKSDFTSKHVIYAPYVQYPKIQGYINVDVLIRYRDYLLIDMECQRKTIPHHHEIICDYDKELYRNTTKNYWDPYTDTPIQQPAKLCYILRRIVNSDESRQTKLLEIFEHSPRLIIFYNFTYELEILRSLYWGPNVEVAEWNGLIHQEVPKTKSWVYFVQYLAGAEAWNCITTDTIIFYSQTYSFKTLDQARGRIDRLNTPFVDLHYYYFKSKANIDQAISAALDRKESFNEKDYVAALKI